jgi:hypothetical protein
MLSKIGLAFLSGFLVGEVLFGILSRFLSERSGASFHG